MAMAREPDMVAIMKLGGEIIDSVRSSTGLSHEDSRLAARTTIDHARYFLNQHPDQIGLLLSTLECENCIANNSWIVSRGDDAKNMIKILNNLMECKADEQQRSWALYEDETNIIEWLEELLLILMDADQSISKYVLQRDNFIATNELVQYYQMETRWTIRKPLLQCFTSMSAMDQNINSALLNSILPMELSREVVEYGNDTARLMIATDALILLLRFGEKMPYSHFDMLDAKFADCVFDLIELPPEDEEDTVDHFVRLILAFNLQFRDGEENIVMNCLASRIIANNVCQKLLNLLNREEDPVSSQAEIEGAPCLFKFMTDIFSSKESAGIFYTNDMNVLIDIVARSLIDLGAGDKRRLFYIKLMYQILLFSNYSEHRHRLEEIRKRLNVICAEEDEESAGDRELILKMKAEFPLLFPY